MIVVGWYIIKREGDISEEEWATYTIEDIEKLASKYGCPVTGYNEHPGTGETHSHYEYTVKGAIDNLLKNSSFLCFLIYSFQGFS